MTSFKLLSIESTYFQFSNSKLSHSPCHTEGNLCMLKSTKINAGTTSGPGTRWIWVIQPARQGALTPGCSDQWLEVLGQIYDEVKSTLVNDGFTQRLWNVLMLWFLEGCTHHGQKVVTWQGMISDPWREIPHNEASLQNLIHSENWWFLALKSGKAAVNIHTSRSKELRLLLWNQMSIETFICIKTVTGDVCLDKCDPCRQYCIP